MNANFKSLEVVRVRVGDEVRWAVRLRLNDERELFTGTYNVWGLYAAECICREALADLSRDFENALKNFIPLPPWMKVVTRTHV